jgi:polyisoprenoid-binding protein YceI
MKKIIIYIACIFLVQQVCIAQKYFTKNGHVSFFSKTNAEDIKATNDQVISVLNTQTGDLQFSIIIKSFHFEKALMEEHFNENYLESEKYPKSTFKGIIADISAINFGKDGSYSVKVSGDLTMHGVTQKVTANGKITVAGTSISATSKFIVKLADYKIDIPKLVKDNIAQNQEITVTCSYIPKI